MATWNTVNYGTINTADKNLYFTFPIFTHFFLFYSIFQQLFTARFMLLCTVVRA